jgi:orotidine-5'-phosphate decarboxylase
VNPSTPPPTPGSPSTSATPRPSPLQRVAVALDTDSRDQFRRWCRELGPRVGVLKVGLEAFVRWGPPAVEEANRTSAGVFLDLKLHDIPNTVAGAVRGARELGVRYLTLHAGGGPSMLSAAVEAAAGDLELLAVTLLTHLDSPALEALGLPGEPQGRVLRWAGLAKEAGVSGVVCSPREAAALRAAHPRPFLLVTPGVRPAGASTDDQRRVTTPAQAVRDGADLLVIGRPITRAPDPGKALEALTRELSEV